jgi:hypothetical protein
MSELRVALIAEGPTDGVVIEAALKAILPRSFTLAFLQPEPTRPRLGTGWCGVFKWCREFADRSHACLEADPTLPGFDLFVIHVDADVAEKKYADGGVEVEVAVAHLPTLPCSRPCPPPGDTVDEMRTRILAWLGVIAIGPKTVLCVPSKASEAWLAAALLDGSQALLQGLECNLNVGAKLASLPVASRIKKKTREYQTRKLHITSAWDQVRQRCTQAERFSAEVESACP